ncbi:MAG TPA: hypothetical protein VK177_15120 [Flavobacteriales bacterium]|nr:hypothetical protein [Flavobacteriales bacterium]
MKHNVKNTNPQREAVDTENKKGHKGTSVSEESIDTLKKKSNKEVAKSPVEKENKEQKQP